MSKQVTLPYDLTAWLALKWAKQNCPNYITNRATADGKICYYFAVEEDATLFTPKWL